METLVCEFQSQIRTSWIGANGHRCRVARSPSNFTYLFTPHSVLQPLFSSFNMEYKGIVPFNATKVLQPNDTLPLGLDAADVAIGGAGSRIIVPGSSDVFQALFYDNGVAHSFHSTPLSLGMHNVKKASFKGF